MTSTFAVYYTAYIAVTFALYGISRALRGHTELLISINKFFNSPGFIIYLIRWKILASTAAPSHSF